MATDWQASRLDIINAALRKISSNDSGDTIPSHELDDAAFQLNALIKEFMARGIDLWLRREVTLFLQSGTSQYLLGATHATEDYAETTMRVAGVAADIDLEVVSTEGMTLGDSIGVRLDDGSIHWTTIFSVTDTDTVTLDDGLPSAAAIGQPVYAYTTKSERPQKILTAYRRDRDGNDTPVNVISRVDYSDLSNKATSSGPVTQIHHDPQKGSSVLYVWPTTDTTHDKLILIVRDIVSNVDTAASIPEFPAEWHNALVWNLALELMPEYADLAPNKAALVTAMAKEKLNTLLDYDVGEASVRFALGDRQWG